MRPRHISVILVILLLSLYGAFGVNESTGLDSLSSGNSSSNDSLENTTLGSGSFSGNVTESQSGDITSYYVQLQDVENSSVATMYQQNLIPNESVEWMFYLPIAESELGTLFNVVNSIPLTFHNYIESYRIISKEQVVSTSSIFTPTEIEYYVFFKTSPIQIDVSCDTKTIADLIPDDATIISSDLDLNSFLKSNCEITSTYPNLPYQIGTLSYASVGLDVEGEFAVFT